MEHGFGVVAGGVAGGDGARALALGGEGEELVAQAAGGLLHARAHLGGGEGHVALARHTGHIEPLAEFGHEVAVGGGVGAQLVVEVGGGHLEAVRLAQFAQEEEGGDGVGAAADGDDELREAAEEALAPGEAPHALQGRRRVGGHYLGKSRSHHSPDGCWSEGGGGLSTTNAVSPSRT